MNKYIISIGNSINGEKDWSHYFGDYKNSMVCQYTLYPLRGDVVIYYAIYEVSQVPEVLPADNRRISYGAAEEVVQFLTTRCPAVPEEFIDEFLQRVITMQRDYRIKQILS